MIGMQTTKPIASVAKVVMGQSPPGGTYNESGKGLPLLNGPTEFGQTFPTCTLFTTDSRRECEPQDLIFCVRGSTTGRMNWADRKYSLGRGVCAFRGESESDTRFIRYCIENQLPELLNLAGGGTFPNLTKNDIEEFELPWPNNRNRIAEIICAYDDLIENNMRRIKILEEMAQAVYREWFIHFRFPGHDKVKMVNSPLGKIPEGWEVKKVGDVIALAYGKALKADNRMNGVIPVYGSGGVVGFHNQALVTGPGIIVGRKGNVGSVYWSDSDFYPIDTVYYVQTRVSLHYVYYDLQQQNFINNDAAVPGLNRNQAYLLPFLLPSRGVLNLFQHFADDIFKQTRNLRSKNTNLRRTRDLLLPKLISGDLKVKDRSRFSEGAIE